MAGHVEPLGPDEGVALREVQPLELRGEGVASLLDLEAGMRSLAGGFVFLEGPVWNADEDTLYFSDIRNDSRWRWSEERGAELVLRPCYVGNGMVYDRDGALLVCEHVTSSVIRIDAGGCRSVVACAYQGTYLNSPNDIVTRSDGMIYFTDPNYGRWDHAVGVARCFDLDFQGLFRVDPRHNLVELAAAEDEFDQPNGLCFSPDESILYVDDVRGIKAFHVAPDGSLGPARIFHDAMGDDGSGVPGEPDGMKCDERGNVWCAARGGVWVVAESGELLGVIQTPEVTANLAWGGPELRSLYLCTSTTLRRIETRVASAPLPYH